MKPEDILRESQEYADLQKAYIQAAIDHLEAFPAMRFEIPPPISPDTLQQAKEPGTILDANAYFEARWAEALPLPWGVRWLSPVIKRYTHFFFDYGYIYGKYSHLM